MSATPDVAAIDPQATDLMPALAFDRPQRVLSTDHYVHRISQVPFAFATGSTCSVKLGLMPAHRAAGAIEAMARKLFFRMLENENALDVAHSMWDAWPPHDAGF